MDYIYNQTPNVFQKPHFRRLAEYYTQQTLRERGFWISRPAYCCLITCRHLRDVGCSINDDHSWINVTRAFPVAKRYVDESKWAG